VAVTLLQYMQDTRADDLSTSLVQMFNDFSPVFSEIPMEDNGDSIFYDYEQVALLPSTGWRAFNTAWSESTGVTVPYREYLKVLGGEAKWDVQFANRRTISRQTEMKVLSAIKSWDAAFFEGTPISDANSMVGLRARIGGNQLILNASGGGALTLAKLSSLVDAVPFSSRQEQGMKRGEGIRKVLYMNRTLRNKIDSLIAAQTGSLRIETTKDEFGTMVERFRDAVIRVVETTGDGTTTLGFDEDPGDGVSDCASIYCVAFGEGLLSARFRTRGGGKALDTKKVDELEAEPRGMIRFEGMYGIAADHPRAYARLHAITNA
jgi:hypothetical protein